MSRKLTLTLLFGPGAEGAARDTLALGAHRRVHERLTRDDDYDEVWQRERALMEQGLPMSVGEVTWSRDDVHER